MPHPRRCRGAPIKKVVDNRGRDSDIVDDLRTSTVGGKPVVGFHQATAM